MSVETAAQAAYIVAALLFIAALAGLSKHETAKVGNRFGIAGMAVALVATIVAGDRPRHRGRRRRSCCSPPSSSAPRSACGAPASSR